MDVKEITALRKSGQIDQALEAAESLYQTEHNTYTANALFWCLNEKCKNIWGEEGQAIYERMQQLYKDHGEGNEYMLSTLHHVERHLIPHASAMRRAADAAKDGADAIGPYHEFSAIYDKGGIDKRIHNDYGWLLYNALKQTSTNNVHESKKMLLRYLQLDLPRPSWLHSHILEEAIKIEKASPENFQFSAFADMWGLGNIREEDWQKPTTKQGLTLPSLVEKTISAYMKEVREDKIEPSDSFYRLIDAALDRLPNHQLLPYYKATLLVAQGRKDEAIGHYCKLLQRFPGKSYYWHQLSSLIEEPDRQLGILCKGITCGDRPDYLGNLRLEAAKILIGKSLYANAKTELDIYRTTYEKQGWHLKNAFNKLAERIPTGTEAVDNTSLYQQYAPLGESIVYSDCPTEIAVKINERKFANPKNPKYTNVTWTLKTADKIYSLKRPMRYGLPPQMPNGAVFTVTVAEGHIIKIQPLSQVPQLGWLKVVHGPIALKTSKKGEPYGNVDNVYVQGALINGLSDAQLVTVTAVLQSNGLWVALGLWP